MYGRRLRAGNKVDSPFRDLQRDRVFTLETNLLAEVLTLQYFFSFGFLFSMLILTSLSSFLSFLYCDSIFSFLERDEMIVELRFLHLVLTFATSR